MFTSFCYNWTLLSEAAKNAAQPCCRQLPNYEDAPTTTIILQINLPDWCWNEFRSSEINLSMFTSFCYKWTLLSEAAKNAAQPCCCQLPNYEDAPTTTIIQQINLPDWCWNEFGSHKIYLSMFTSSYNDWTLAEAAKHSTQTHCCQCAKLWRCINHNSTPGDKPSLIGVGTLAGVLPCHIVAV